MGISLASKGLSNNPTDSAADSVEANPLLTLKSSIDSRETDIRQQKRQHSWREAHPLALRQGSVSGPRSLPLDGIAQAHSKLLSPDLHAAADHEAVAGLEDVEGAGHGGEGHGADKYRHALVQAVRRNDTAMGKRSRAAQQAINLKNSRPYLG